MFECSFECEPNQGVVFLCVFFFIKFQIWVLLRQWNYKVDESPLSGSFSHVTCVSILRHLY